MRLGATADHHNLPPDTIMYLNCEELAAILRVNPETIRRKTRSGVIPHIRVGTSVRYVMADVERALTEAAQKEVKN